MPFKSESQRRFLWARHPDVARKWADKYDTPKNLPRKKARGFERLARGER